MINERVQGCIADTLTSIRWQELHVSAESRKQEYGYYNINLLGSRLVHFLPKWGKQRAQVG